MAGEDVLIVERPQAVLEVVGAGELDVEAGLDQDDGYGEGGDRVGAKDELRPGGEAQPAGPGFGAAVDEER